MMPPLPSPEVQSTVFLSVSGRLAEQEIVIGTQNPLDDLGAVHGAAQGERATVCSWCSDWILCTPERDAKSVRKLRVN